LNISFTIAFCFLKKKPSASFFLLLFLEFHSVLLFSIFSYLIYDASFFLSSIKFHPQV